MKDYIPLIFSLIAVAISLASTVFDRIKHRRSNRKELTDTLEKLLNLDLTFANSAFNWQENTNPEEAKKKQEIDIVLNHQRTYLVNHAEYLSNLLKDNAISNDYRIIAFAYSKIGDLDKAKGNFEKALSRPASMNAKQMTMRAFGRLLYRMGEFQNGIQIFNKAVEISTPHERYKRDTYLSLVQWAAAELDYSQECENFRDILLKMEEVIKTTKNFTEDKTIQFRKLADLNNLYNKRIQLNQNAENISK